MAITTKASPQPKQINILIVDDSLVFRRLLREIFEQANSVNVIGEARNGIEALSLILKLSPDVIVIDMEMPLMDGMTTLQHLMIHKPTPTIMLSSLTQEGTARGFDAIKNGALDFICKDTFFKKKITNHSFGQELIYKAIYASKVMVRPVEPVFTGAGTLPRSEVIASDIIFCEECGARNVVDDLKKAQLGSLTCKQCGDLLEAGQNNKYKRINFVTVIGSGLGGYSNLLRIIPEIPEDISGAIIIILHAEDRHVHAFTEYLDAVSTIKVKPMVDGLTLEGGCCYIASATDMVQMKPYSVHYTIRKIESVSGCGSIDVFMDSVSSVFKDKVAGFLLSGTELDGVQGIEAIKKNHGYSMVLNSKHCLCKEMGENILRKCNVDKIVDEHDAAELIIDLHRSAGNEPLTA